MESQQHRNLRYQAGGILKRFKWNYEYTGKGLRGVDIVAHKRNRIWKIEIEVSGQNIGTDIRNGAQIFIVPRRSKRRIERIIRSLSSGAPIVTIGEFEDHVRRIKV